MELSKQVTNLELSKKLKELGVKQESCFTHVWVMRSINDTHDVYEIRSGHKPTLMSTEYSAFTVAELGEILPRDFDYKVSTYKKNGYEGTRPLVFNSGKTIINEGWYVMYSDPHPANKIPIYTQHADTEADARAKMLIYLLEHNLLTL